MKFKMYLLITLCFLSSLLITGQSSSFPWPDGKAAALSLTFDDARLSHVDVGLELFRELDARATFYVNPYGVDQRLEGWKELVADGHEIGNHTYFHPCTGNFAWSRDKALESYSLSSMKRELLLANHYIQETLGVNAVSFAYTCGNTFVGRGSGTKSYVPLIAEIFESGRGWMNEAPNDPYFMDLSQVQGVEMDGKDFEEDIRPLLEQAVENSAWLVLAGHEIGEEDRQTTKVEMLQELVAYATRPDSRIWLTTVGEAAEHIRNHRILQAEKLKASLTLAATFDGGYSADFARGDNSLYGSPAYDKASVSTEGFIPEEVTLAKGRGVHGDALEFKRKGQPVVFFKSRDNITYDEKNWNGTISLWLSLNPEEDLAPGYTDPIQITDSGYDDAAFWVDFTNENPRIFRMGVFGDVDVWNPKNLNPDTNAGFLDRLVTAVDRPFERGRWTHVVMTFEGINGKNGKASFYINGVLQGERQIPERFTWDYDQSRIYLGLNYIGLLDEVAIFDRALLPEEVRNLYLLNGGIGDLMK